MFIFSTLLFLLLETWGKMELEHLSVGAVIEIASVGIFSGQDGEMEMESSHYPIAHEQQLLVGVEP